MLIRNYQPGDEHAQAEIYNTVAGKLPKFKPATAEEIGRRYATSDHDPTSKFYAIADGRVVGYAVLNPNGRISYPWCLPGGDTIVTTVWIMALALGATRTRGTAGPPFRGPPERVLTPTSWRT